MSYVDTLVTLAAVGMLVAGALISAIWFQTRNARRQVALARWRAKLQQLHEDHMTKRDAWTRQGNPRQTHRHDATVKAAQALQDHIARMPAGPL